MKKRPLLILLGLAVLAGIVIGTLRMNDKNPDDQNVPAPQNASLPQVKTDPFFTGYEG